MRGFGGGTLSASDTGRDDAADRLGGLLDYIEQVVRLDERVAFRLADYRLPDGSALALRSGDVAGLPGIALDVPGADAPAWLAVDRLARLPPPEPPPQLAPWLDLAPDPDAPPAARAERLEEVSDAERQALIAADRAAEEDFAPVPAREGTEGHGAHHLRLRFSEQPGLAAALDAYRAGPWATWTAAEAPRRRTVALYGQLYRLQQALELGGGEGAVEAVWGIGTARWRRGGRTVDRPLIECGVEVELAPDGRLAVRPTGAPPRIDLKPYEEMGCDGLPALDAALRAELERAAAGDGVSPFAPASFEPALRLAATRLAAGGHYAPGPAEEPGGEDGPRIDGGWTLFARPRSRHVLIDDIARLRSAARAGLPASGLARRLVTPPVEGPAGGWAPLADRLGAALGDVPPPPGEPAFGDVFFPKPFNDDQVAVVRRLDGAEGLVVQGPPGTGKTHTIANIICHNMALGRRVLVVSRGEAALSVLRDQLPEKVRPLTIAILSSEREGLRQVEGAIREIQAVVEESRPEIRLSAIRRCESEILKVRARLDAIDAEVDGLAAREDSPLGPAGEPPAVLARWAADTRVARAWFDDAPALYAAEAGLDEGAIERLREARAAAGGFLDHAGAALPDPASLPSPEEAAAWHAVLLDGERLRAAAARGPARAVQVAPGDAEPARRAAAALRDLAGAAEDAAALPWLAAPLASLLARDGSAAAAGLGSFFEDWRDAEAERARLAPLAVELPPDIAGDPEAREAIARAARGERMWPLVAFGAAASKALLALVRLRGAAPARDDAEGWRAVGAAADLLAARAALGVRWRGLAEEAGLPAGAPPGEPGPAMRLIHGCARAGAALGGLGPAGRGLPAPGMLAREPARARALADQLDAAAGLAGLAEAEGAVAAASAHFPGDDRTSVMARQILGELVGRPDLAPDRVGALWRALLGRLGDALSRAPALAAVRDGAEAVARAGAPLWAMRLRADPDPGVVPPGWRDAWDGAAAEGKLARADAREALSALGRERDALDRRGRKLFVELVRERAFHALERRLSPAVKSALVEYVRAVARLGKGTGKGAGRHRRAARDAMARCYDAVPCWIMPSWRVAEQLPADLAAFDLVVLDEASQSDVTEIPALLRGRKVLAVGDDRQVSPTPPFVTQVAVAQLRRRYLSGLPYAPLLEPGESLYDLLRAVFPDNRLMLKEHFRCVEPIIRFSMGFYPEKLIPLRVPSAAERLDPPLVDILVPHGARDGARKVNRAEAEVIVAEVAALIAAPEGAERSVGVISLIGSEQAELVRVLLAERIGEEAMQRHRVLCSDSAGFQGNERDVVFLSMVADRRRRATLTALPYEQRFNVAASRARDRLVLVRSVGLDDLSTADLKHRLIGHFERPMPAGPAPGEDPAALCESGFEREVLLRLLALGYRVLPQVGSEGFRIDLVVEDFEGRRLAVECDGDSFHGPERWRDDMRRQRVLERVGWRFWRCFASSFYRDPEGVVADLVAALERQGIRPVAGAAGAGAAARLVEHRTAPPPAGDADPAPRAEAGGHIAVGDRVALLFADRSRLTLRLTDGADDRAGGLLSIATPLGEAVARAEEGDEVEVAEGGSPSVRVLIEAVLRAA